MFYNEASHAYVFVAVVAGKDGSDVCYTYSTSLKPQHSICMTRNTLRHVELITDG